MSVSMMGEHSSVTAVVNSIVVKVWADCQVMPVLGLQEEVCFSWLGAASVSVSDGGFIRNKENDVEQQLLQMSQDLLF
ncbi:uncharacterized protein LOC128548365 isoform X2 [Mercenaria mercenaria]|uniref:uncharacterized protein LOC128548365 isoform X2 n=1 Tax=Mercenaria mercenaria TaxID=6596 RepID=UPI00234E6D33|nr:uncharacterized protein LOC128548365 isoform X2 [Mercenaria mercenaria]